MKDKPLSHRAVSGEQLTAFLLGELSGEAAETLQRHLETCEVCRAEARELQKALDLTREALADPALAASLAERLTPDRRQHVLEASERGRRLWLLEVPWRIPAAAAAMLLIGFAVFAWRLSSRHEAQYASGSGGLAGQRQNAVLLARRGEISPEVPAQPTIATSESTLADVTLDLGNLAGGDREGQAESVAVLAGAPAAAPLPARTASPARAPAAEVASVPESPQSGQPPAAASAREFPVAATSVPAEPPTVFAPSAARVARRDVTRSVVALNKRLASVRVPAMDFEGISAREAVERLNALLSDLPEAEGLRAKWSDAPLTAASAVVAEAEVGGPQVLSEPTVPGERHTRARTFEVRGKAADSASLTLEEAVRRLAEHYGLRYRFTEAGVEFFPGDPADQP